MVLRNKWFIIIVVIIVVVFFIIPIGWYLFFNSNSIDSNDQYNDPLSGETVYNPVNRTPEKYDDILEKPIILGLPGLLDSGISYVSVQEIESAFLFYMQNSNEGKEISIDVKSITMEVNKDDSNSKYKFLIRPDRDIEKDSNVEVIIDQYDAIYSFIIKRNNKIIFNLDEIEIH